MSDIGLNILINAKNNASGVFSGLGTGLKNIAFGMRNLSTEGTIGFSALNQGAVGVGGAFAKIAAGAAVAGVAIAVGIGVASVKAAADYQQSMNSVQALTGSTQAQMTQYDVGVKRLAVDAGVAPLALSKGLYNVLSASYTGTTAMKVLTLATEDSKIGMTSAAVTTDALTNVLRTFKVQNQDVTRVNGEMLQTVTMGKSTFEQYATTIVKSASASTQFHVSMETMNAAWSTLTSSGIRAAQASTDYQSSLKVMYGNIGTSNRKPPQNGIAFDETKFNAMSYGDKVVYLNAALEQANEKHVKVTGATLQASQAIQTIAQHIGDYNNNLAKLSDKQAMAQKTQEAWNITQGGFNQSMDRIRATIDVLLINIGARLLPTLTKLAQQVIPIITAFTDWLTQSHAIENGMDSLTNAIVTTVHVGSQIISFFQHNQVAMDALLGVLITVAGFIAYTLVAAFVAWAASMVPVVIGAAAIIGPLLLVAAVVAGVILAIQHWSDIVAFLQTTLTQFENAVNQVFSQIKQGVSDAVSSVMGWFNQWKDTIERVGGALLFFFLPALIKAGIQAGIAGAKITASFVQSLVQTGTASVVNGAKTSASFVASMVKSGVEAVVNGAKITVSFIASIIKSGVEAVISGAKITASFIASLIQTGVEGWASAGKIAVFVGSMIASGTQAVLNGAKIVASFVASLVTSGAQAVLAGAKIAASFIVSIAQAGIQAVITGAQMVASLVPAIISVIVESTVAAITAIPALVVAFGAWVVGALAAAAATLAATWPILAVIAVVALLVVGIYLLVTHWQQVTTFLQNTWQNFTTWLTGSLNGLGANMASFFSGLASQATQWGANIISNLISGIESMVGAAGNAAHNVMQSIASFLKSGSPTKKGIGTTLMSWGPNIVKQVANGMVSSTGLIETAANTAMTGAHRGFTKHRHTTTTHHHKGVTNTAPTSVTGTGMVLLSTFNKDLSTNTAKAHGQAESILSTLMKTMHQQSEQVLKLHLEGNKVQEKQLRDKLNMESKQFQLYKDAIKDHGLKFDSTNANDPINFAYHKKRRGLGAVKAPGGSGISSTGSSGYGSSGGATYVTYNNNYYLTLGKGTSRQQAEEIYQYIKDKENKDFRRQASYTTTSSGGTGA